MRPSERVLKVVSYSQIEVVIAINEEIKEHGCFLIMSILADKKKLTKSVIVTTIRLLEVAGIVESKSMGMKGTYFNIIDQEEWDNLLASLK